MRSWLMTLSVAAGTGFVSGLAWGDVQVWAGVGGILQASSCVAGSSMSLVCSCSDATVLWVCVAAEHVLACVIVAPGHG